MNKIIQGDCLEVLKTLPDESVNCVVTSPPYWNLRDYQTEGQLGLEPIFQEYINNLCDIFDEVKRVLRKDGTCWVNVGDTYGCGCGGSNTNSKLQKGNNGSMYGRKSLGMDKSLVQIPSRFAIKMTDRGWILRNEIVWFKPNVMPSSVKDRFTVDFEKVFFFVKSKKYWFEQIIENQDSICTRKRSSAFRQQKEEDDKTLTTVGRNKRTVWQITTKPYKEAHFATYPEELIEPMIKSGCPEKGVVLDPFIGSGTTAVVALKQNKNYIGIELNPEYIKLAEDRIKAVPQSLF